MSPARVTYLIMRKREIQIDEAKINAAFVARDVMKGLAAAFGSKKGDGA